MRFDIITIFPEFFASIFGRGVVSRAIENSLVEVRCHDLRTFTHDRHRTVDDRPFGGGEGMVLKPEPLAEAVDSLGMESRETRALRGQTVILLSAQGRKFDQTLARELAGMQQVVMLCGRYEGVDERVSELIADRELSIGDYVLSGGELAAAVIADATMRLIPGVLGNEASAQFESFGLPEISLPEPGSGAENSGPPKSTHGSGGLLDYPHYTRPAEFRGCSVPEVLSSGNHEQIRRWRRARAIEKTLRNRPDLLAGAQLSEEDRDFLRRIEEEGSKAANRRKSGNSPRDRAVRDRL